MSNILYINQFVSISPDKVTINNESSIINEEKSDFRVFTKQIYRSYALQYPKFFKMDEHSRLGFLAASLLLGPEPVLENENTAMVMMNSESTLFTDSQYKDSISGIPSPALFVYTLPNIVMGEIAIKYKLKGENIFLVEPAFEAQKLYDHTSLIFDTTPTQSCIAGWVNVESTKNYLAVLYLVERIANSQKCITFDPTNIKKTFQF